MPLSRYTGAAWLGQRIKENGKENGQCADSGHHKEIEGKDPRYLSADDFDYGISRRDGRRP